MNDEWGTPQKLFDKLDKQFNFVLDAAASYENHKVSFYYTKESNSLDKEWTLDGWIWCNPPYSRNLIIKFADKFLIEAKKGARIVALVRLDPGANWFKTLMNSGYTDVYFLDKRLKFEGAASSYPFPCCLLVISPLIADDPLHKTVEYCGVPK